MIKELEKLLEKIDEAVRRDVNCILLESARGKLSPTSARDLVQYRKLVTDAIQEIDAAGEDLPERTEEELKTLAKELLNEETDPRTSSK